MEHCCAPKVVPQSDGLNYIVSLYVLSHTIKVRAWSSVAKVVTMAALGVYIAVEIVLSVLRGDLPNSEIMTWPGWVGC